METVGGDWWSLDDIIEETKIPGIEWPQIKLPGRNPFDKPKKRYYPYVKRNGETIYKPYDSKYITD